MTLLILAPLLRPGFILSYDMVFVPELPFRRELLGLGAVPPRAVPSDLLVALASRIVPSAVLQKVILAGVLLGAGWGAGRLVPSTAASARAAAAVFYLWNPFVYERLVLGQWTLLVSYAALPWVARAAVDLRTAAAGSAARSALWLAVASFGSPSGGVIATLLTTAVVLLPPRRAAVRSSVLVLGLAVALNAPWWVPGLLHPGGLPSRPEGVAAFAAESDTKLGLVGSLVTLGGVWNGEVVPPGRSTWAVVPALVLILVVVGLGVRNLVRRWGAAPGMVAAAVLGLCVALVPALPGGSRLWEGLIESIPAAGLFRDTQRFIAPLALLEALGFALGVEAIVAGLEGRRFRRLAGGAMALLPVVAMPALAWGASGRLGVAHYPAEWSQAQASMEADEVPGGVAVLPWHQYVRFPWNGGRVVYNPALKFFDRRAVGNDALELRTITVPGEDPWAMRVARALEGPGDRSGALADAGIRYVLWVNVGRPTRVPVEEGTRILDTPELSLYRLGGTEPPPDLPTPPAAPVIVGDLLAAGIGGWGAVRMALLKCGRR